MENAIISVENLYKSFGPHEVLAGVNLSITKGESLVILGGSGTGKSVLIKTIIGLIRPSSGRIFIDGVETAKASNIEKAHMLQKCGFLFQAGALFDSLNIEDNITFFAEKLYNLNNKQKRELAKDKLEAVGLSDRLLKLFPAELSGGMQKRAALARTIATNPEIIFFDEPTTGLDPVMSNVINDLILRVKTSLGATCITITHDMNTARRVADRVAMIHKGKISWQGNVTELDKTKDPLVRQFVDGSTEGPFFD